MKKIVLFFSFMLLCIGNVISQDTINTGVMKIFMNQYGRIRLFASDGIKQLERASILVGTSPTAVFDYQNDSEQLEPTVLVENPEMSDFELYGAYDNTYSNLPPDVIIKQHAYGWTNGEYTIVKFIVKNDETSAINATIGLDLIPSLNEEYGFDTVTYLSDEGVIRFHRGTQVNMGIKLLSASLSSLYSFEYYEDYSVDSDYWIWMNHGSLQPQYTSHTDEGMVTITAQSPVAIAPGQSFDVYYALALGINKQAMLSNISAAEEKYQAWFIGIDDNELSASALKLNQNYPNPFEQSTMISYHLPVNGNVNLTIYDVMGNEAALLVNEEQKMGTHMLQYDAGNLKSGVYYCTLRFNGQTRTTMMMLAR